MKSTHLSSRMLIIKWNLTSLNSRLFILLSTRFDVFMFSMPIIWVVLKQWLHTFSDSWWSNVYLTEKHQKGIRHPHCEQPINKKRVDKRNAPERNCRGWSGDTARAEPGGKPSSCHNSTDLRWLSDSFQGHMANFLSKTSWGWRRAETTPPQSRTPFGFQTEKKTQKGLLGYVVAPSCHIG